MLNIYEVGATLFTEDSLDHVINIAVVGKSAVTYRFERVSNGWNYFEDKFGTKKLVPETMISSEILVQHLNRLLEQHLVATTRDIDVTCDSDYDYDIIEKKANKKPVEIDYVAECNKVFDSIFGDLFSFIQ